MINRRNFLELSAAAAAGWALPVEAAHVAGAGNVRFVFFTDTHIEPELSGNRGVARALAKIKAARPEFCIQGGDHCYDLNATPRQRSTMLLDLYSKTEQVLDMPIHHVIGNHDVFGTLPMSGVSHTDPLWGKKAFYDHFGKTHTSWDYKGYHFITLDSIHLDTNGKFAPIIDEEQREWLAADLATTPAGMPIIGITHVPLVSAVPQYAHEAYPYFKVSNAYDVLPLFEGHNVIAVLQGHTHVNEVVYWRNVPYITSGAVCGNWWKGSRWGTPEGFTVVELSGGRIRWRYEVYGWTSAAPERDPYPVITNPSIPGSWPKI